MSKRGKNNAKSRFHATIMWVYCNVRGLDNDEHSGLIEKKKSGEKIFAKIIDADTGIRRRKYNGEDIC